MKSLLFAIAATIAVIYVPGFFLLRSIRFSRLTAVICAPVVAFFLYSILPIIYWPLGIECNPVTVGLIPLVICLVCYIASHLIRSASKSRATRASHGKPIPDLDVADRSTMSIGSLRIPFEWLTLGLYLAFGLFACWFMFVSQLSSAETFIGRWDNQLHFNAVRSFLDSGQWSSLHVSSYATSPDYAIPYVDHTERYPAAWHDIVALVCAVSSRSIVICTNALNITLVALVYPAAMFLLIKVLFPDDKFAIIAGAGVVSAFTAFPWGMFLKGPLYPNFAGFVIMVPVLAVIVAFAERKLIRRMPGSFTAFAAISLVALVFTHPNSLIAGFVFLAAYASHAAWVRVRASEKWNSPKQTAIAALSGLAVLLVAGAALVACTFAPPLQGIVQFTIVPKLSASAAFVSTALLNLGRIALTRTAPEYLLALIAWCGVVYCIMNRRFWLLLPAAYMALAFVLASSTDAPTTRLIAGYWYNDPVRLAACYELFLVPIAAYGLAGVARIPNWIAGKVSNKHASGSSSVGKPKTDSSAIMPIEPPDQATAMKSSTEQTTAGKLSKTRAPRGKANVAATLIIAVVSVALFIPAIPLPDGTSLKFGIGEQQKLVHRRYTIGKKAVYSQSERKFVKAARNAIPEGSLVLNMPHDGSIYSYGLDNLNTYYRRISHKKETDASKLIRTKLADFASDPTVREAVKSTGAEYLIMLDQGIARDADGWMQQYVEASWKGINAVTDNTSGFTVVLAKDDMRLYHIDF